MHHWKLLASCAAAPAPKEPKEPAASAPSPAPVTKKPAPSPAPAAKKSAAKPAAIAPAPALARRHLLAASEPTHIHCAIYVGAELRLYGHVDACLNAVCQVLLLQR